MEKNLVAYSWLETLLVWTHIPILHIVNGCTIQNATFFDLSDIKRTIVDIEECRIIILPVLMLL